MSPRPHRLRRAALGLALAMIAAAPAAAAPVQLPPYTKATLKNGLTVFVMPTHRLPLVDFRLVARAGSIYDPPGKEGLASLLSDLITQGAGARNAKQIAEDIAFVGGSLEAGTGPERLVVTCEVLRKDFATGLELFHDVIVQPTFPAEEFARKKDEALAGIAAARDDPSSVANDMMLPFFMPGSALGHPVAGWEKSVTTITRDDVAAFHRRFVTPESALLAVVGDVDAKATVAALERAFGDWKGGGEKPALDVAPLAQSGGPRIQIVDKPEVTQTQIRFGGLGVPRNHPDYYPIRVINTILGAGFTSRLVNEIRVIQGLTYSIGSGFNMYRNTGTFTVSTFTRNETLRRTIDETLRVIRQLASEGPSPEELDKAKRYLTGQFPLGLQASDQLAAQLLDVEFYGLDPRFVESFSDRINAVTMDDAKRAARSYLNADALQILVVSHPDSARRALAGLGTIEVKEIP
jgi:zinc protease